MSGLLHKGKIQIVFSSVQHSFPVQVMQLAVECSESAGAVLSAPLLAQFSIVFCCT